MRNISLQGRFNAVKIISIFAFDSQGNGRIFSALIYLRKIQTASGKNLHRNVVALDSLPQKRRGLRKEVRAHPYLLLIFKNVSPAAERRNGRKAGTKIKARGLPLNRLAKLPRAYFIFYTFSPVDNTKFTSNSTPIASAMR